MRWFVAPPARAGLQCPIKKRSEGPAQERVLPSKLRSKSSHLPRPSRPSPAWLGPLGGHKVHKSVKFYTMAGTAMPRSHRGTGVSPVNDWAV